MAEIYMGERLSDSVDRDNEADDAIDLAAGGDVHAHEHVDLLIDELKKRTAELEQANRELRRVSHYRSLFLARMSHELRTPLTSILGFSEILLDQEELTDTQRRFCQKVQDSGFQLQSSLNQLVDLSRIEAGQTEVFLQEFSVRETLRESCAAVARIAQRQQVKVEYELAPEITTMVSDQGKLRQILFNFIGWAVSRSPAGDAVKIFVEVVGNNMMQFNLVDNGELLEETSHVFEPDGSTASPEPNINELGVIIGRKLLELMDGTVVVQNRDQQGLETMIQIPARPLKG
jgi:signal transduction histidine kinase